MVPDVRRFWLRSTQDLDLRCAIDAETSAISESSKSPAAGAVACPDLPEVEADECTAGGRPPPAAHPAAFDAARCDALPELPQPCFIGVAPRARSQTLAAGTRPAGAAARSTGRTQSSRLTAGVVHATLCLLVQDPGPKRRRRLAGAAPSAASTGATWRKRRRLPGRTRPCR